MPRRRSLLFPTITVLLLFIGIIGSLWALRPPASTQVEIVQNGITIYRLDLLREPDHTISVCYNDGCNLIESAYWMRTVQIRPVSIWGG